MIYAIILVASVGAICLGWGWLLSGKPASLGVSAGENVASGMLIAGIGAILLAGALVGCFWL